MKRKPRPIEPQREIAINLYRSVWEVRNDGWIHLSDNATRLAEAHPDTAEIELIAQRVAETINLLEPIESYWSFPGRQGFERLTRYVDIPPIEYSLPVLACVALSLIFFFLQKDMGPALVFACLFLVLYGIARGSALLVFALP